ncbi:RtcB family protein [Myroides profundi]|uniref:3'-phosphate/5'-hydroxy nucleic acid ligase n=1 Tax=Myroides profundi TaxID=480520 RepID=A0AAJ5BDB6_MYRPR|nr:RtcB family protein [Myroides profundi]AJH13955.1 tRNA-splicing ligase RtcB [Myroides profundi]SEQ48902.1 tRNA-splicing ligase RtcB [Myroides profundi]
MGRKLSGRDFIKIGFPQNNTINIALGQVNRYKKKENKNNILEEAKLVLKNPDSYIGDGIWGKVAESMIKQVEVKKHQLNTNRVPFSIYGEDAIDEQTKYQLFTALKLPVAIQGALMPDAHYGYGLPIGGVLATDNAVIPYGVGVDIGCRMSMSVFNLPASFLKGKDHMLLNILSEHTKFGMYDTHKVKADHEVFSREEFKNIPFVKGLLDKAYKQLGTSGSGNHFVEFGIVRLTETKPEWRLEPGEYIAVLSHSGSRGLGANIAKHYTYLATKQCPLPSNAQHLAWLDLNTHDGQEYWLAMNLAGDYAKACHDDIHRRIAKALGKQIAFTIENHHNFAWKEVINNKELIVHRKGATPAAEGQLGIIPGSMTTNGYIVEGLGNAESLNSASHGAGRLHSRTTCKQKFTKSEIKKELSSTGVQLIGGSVDEAPMAYKDINAVMQAQSELVKVLGSFTPKFVRMDK